MGMGKLAKGILAALVIAVIGLVAIMLARPRTPASTPSAGPAETRSKPAGDAREALQALAAEAAKGPPVVWYESSTEEQIDKVIAAFHKDYPQVKVKFVRLTGGNELASRAVQEMQAQGHTADVLTGGADHIWQLNERGYLEHVAWQTLGVPKALVPTDFAMATAASVYVVMWNTNKVKDADAPKTWEEILDAKWSGRIGHWVRAASFAQLANAWGVDQARQKLERFTQLKPFLFQSTFPLAQQVAAGEVDVAIGFYHTAQPPIKAGAPLKIAALDPTPMHTIYTAISKNAPNRAGAKLLVAWLASPQGAKAYEDATSRGNPLLEGTNTARLLKGKNITEWPPEKSLELGQVNEEFNKILARAGKAR